MADTITQGDSTLVFTYGPDYMRKKTVTTIEGNSTTRYYSGGYEKTVTPLETRELHYIGAYGRMVAIYEITDGEDSSMYYVHTDHLGSVNCITNANDSIVQETSFTACSVKHGFCEVRAKTDVELIPPEERRREGRRRNPVTWIPLDSIPANLKTDRGFTGHVSETQVLETSVHQNLNVELIPTAKHVGKHIDEFNLINMPARRSFSEGGNGRIYDPILCRFLSPDPFVQDPLNSQNFNRYTYVLNNPIAYTDPSGYLTVAEFWAFVEKALDSEFGGYWDVGGGGTPELFHSDNDVAAAGAEYNNRFNSWGYTKFGHEAQPGKKYTLEGGWTMISKRNRGNKMYPWITRNKGYTDVPFYEYKLWLRPIPTAEEFAFGNPNFIWSYTIEMNRFAESPEATVSTFTARGPYSRIVTGYFLEPGGPSTTKSGMDRRIPAGTYNVRPYHSPNLNQDVYILSNYQVSEGRFILLHIGNYPHNTLGCLLPGSSYSMYNGNYAVWNSTATFNSLRSLLGTNKATLTIRDINQ